MTFATAADIPHELLPLILEYVGTDDNGRGDPRDRGQDTDLQDCSLVCVDWANRCRPVLLDMWIEVCSREELKSFEFYGKHGSRRLPPAADFIQGWFLRQTWEGRSWCHVRYTSSFRAKNPYKHGPHADGLGLELRGPVPPSLPVSSLHSPHWSLPRSMPACYTPFTHLTLDDIYFPSLSSLVKLLRHFRYLSELDLWKITWAEDSVGVVSPVAHATTTYFSVSAIHCTDNRRICTLAQDILGRNSPFRQLRAQERDACLALLHPVPRQSPPNRLEPPGATGDERDLPWTSLVFSIFRTLQIRYIYMACYLWTTGLSSSLFRIHHNLRHERSETLFLTLYALTTDDATPHPSSVTALYVSIRRAAMAFNDLELLPLTSCVEQLPSVRLVVLSFWELSEIEVARRADPTVCTVSAPASHGEVTYRFLCLHFENSAFADIPLVYGYYDTLVEIDPVTMQPTGRCPTQS